MSEKSFELQRSVEYAYCDNRGEARLSYILAMAQQISEVHCCSRGVGRDFFLERGMAFLLAKLQLDIPHVPKSGETVTLLTEPNLPMRAQYRRRTSFTAENGELLCSMDSRWVLVDIASRKILRCLPDGIELPFLEIKELPDFRQPTPPADMSLREELTVRYSMLDVNNHMNNTVYGDIISNILENRLLSGERIRSVEIFYRHEALAGEKLKLWCSDTDDSFFIRANIGDVVCFEAAGRLEHL